MCAKISTSEQFVVSHTRPIPPSLGNWIFSEHKENVHLPINVKLYTNIIPHSEGQTCDCSNTIKRKSKITFLTQSELYSCAPANMNFQFPGTRCQRLTKLGWVEQNNDFLASVLTAIYTLKLISRNSSSHYLNAKLLSKCNLGFFSESNLLVKA